MDVELEWIYMDFEFEREVKEFIIGKQISRRDKK